MWCLSIIIIREIVERIWGGGERGKKKKEVEMKEWPPTDHTIGEKKKKLEV